VGSASNLPVSIRLTDGAYLPRAATRSPQATSDALPKMTAVRRLTETLGPNQSGKFYNYDGREYPW
jgi:hypothetical protein